MDVKQSRKFGCDANLEGCAKCVAANIPCKTTDRTTGITTERGQLQRLENDNSQLRAAYFRLERQLISYVHYANGLRASFKNDDGPPPIVWPFFLMLIYILANCDIMI